MRNQPAAQARGSAVVSIGVPCLRCGLVALRPIGKHWLDGTFFDLLRKDVEQARHDAGLGQCRVGIPRDLVMQFRSPFAGAVEAQCVHALANGVDRYLVRQKRQLTGETPHRNERLQNWVMRVAVPFQRSILKVERVGVDVGRIPGEEFFFKLAGLVRLFDPRSFDVVLGARACLRFLSALFAAIGSWRTGAEC